MDALFPTLKRYGTVVCLLHGCFIASIYFALRSLGVKGGLLLFSQAALIIFIANILIRPQKTFHLLTQPVLIWRGTITGMTQILICHSLESSPTSITLLTGIIGTLSGVLLGNIVLGEKLKGRCLIGLFISLAGAVASANWPLLTLSAFFGGFLQGANSIITRIYIRNENGLADTVGGSIGYAGVAGLSGWFLTSGGSFESTFLSGTESVIIITLLLAIVQYGSCLVYAVIDSQRAAAFGLVRLPFSMILEGICISKWPGVNLTAGSLFIIVGALTIMVAERHSEDQESYPTFSQ